MASTNLSRTISTGTDGKKFTLSTWVKRHGTGSNGNGYYFISNDSGSSDTTFIGIGFNTSDRLFVTGFSQAWRQTNRLFRDLSAWYHVVIEIDSTQATASDRIKIYVNGEQETSFAISNDPSLNQVFGTSVSGTSMQVGGWTTGADYIEVALAHTHFIDGTAYDASAFGETDSLTGIWKPKTAPSVTYGTNGFFLKFENSGAFGTDSSGNGNTFTVNGTMTQTIDTPSNVFATMNPLYKPTSGGASYSNGNTTVSTTDAGLVGGNSTLAVTQGKWYAEFKKVSQDSGTADDGYRSWCGVTYVTNAESNPTSTTGYYLLIGTGRAYNGSTDLGLLAGTSYISDNGILQIALDLDNNQVSFGFNGGWMDGSNGWTNSTPTNWISITDPASTEAGYFFTCGDSSTVRSYTTNWNFGNGYFGTTAVSSAQNPDDGIGIFEYDVPAGYRALCTKSINAEEYS
jgi:hypothetical protein